MTTQECIDSKLSLYSRLLFLYFVAAVIILSMCVYLLVQLSKLYRNWRKRQTKFEQHTKLDTSISNTSKFQNILSINTGGNQDNEIYDNKHIDEDKLPEYKFDKNLDSIAESYKMNAGKVCNSTNDPERAFIQQDYDNYTK